MTTRHEIDDFLGLKRIALVGISRDPKDFSRALFNELVKRGYEVVPVNPHVAEIEGKVCFPSVLTISPAVEGALLMVPASQSLEVVKECARAGIKKIWLHQGGGTGAVSQEAIDYCKENGLEVVAGFCPFMFLPDTAFFHRLHGFGKKLVGSYPK